MMLWEMALIAFTVGWVLGLIVGVVLGAEGHNHDSHR